MKLRTTANLFFGTILLFGFFFAGAKHRSDEKTGLSGAWKTQFTDESGKEIIGILVFSDNSFSETYYTKNEFLYTLGGTWKISGAGISQSIEYNTKDARQTGSMQEEKIKITNKTKTLAYNGRSWEKVDDGKGPLAGAWLITGRMRDGDLSTTTPGARRTMKILSGSRFQWIAYNVETKEFFGTGGGTYQVKDGKYIETIEFFSRDASRVGKSLEFDYEIKDGAWHHKGLSSKGDPIYEVWTKRTALNL